MLNKLTAQTDTGSMLRRLFSQSAVLASTILLPQLVAAECNHPSQFVLAFCNGGSCSEAIRQRTTYLPRQSDDEPGAEASCAPRISYATPPALLLKAYSAAVVKLPRGPQRCLFRIDLEDHCEKEALKLLSEAPDGSTLTFEVAELPEPKVSAEQAADDADEHGETGTESAEPAQCTAYVQAYDCDAKGINALRLSMEALLQRVL